MKDFLKKLWGIILQLVYPARCPVCDGIVVPQGERICAGCLKELKVVTPPWCMKCGKKLKKQETFCEDCREAQHLYERGRALYEYESVRTSIYRFKYGGRQEYADFFGEEMCRWLGDFVAGIRPDVLIPIPLHKKRMRYRGYNQAALLARALGREIGVPVREDLLVRIRNTTPLKKLNAKERQNNLKKAFNMTQNEVKLERVVLVDDIYTTGSTIDEAARVLKAAGVKEVYFITIACGAGI